jgi:hypothetical protein
VTGNVEWIMSYWCYLLLIHAATLKYSIISPEIYMMYSMTQSASIAHFLNEFLIYLTGGWRKLHNEELHNLYSSPSIIRIIKSRRMRWVGDVTRIGEKRNVYRLLVGKPEGKRPLGRPRDRWMDNIKMDLLEIGLNVVDWIGLAQDRYRWRALVNSVMNLRVP